MPAAFEDPPPDSPRPPPPHQEVRDDDVGTVLKIGGSSCVAAFGCGCGVILLIVPMTLVPYYGFSPISGAFVLIGIVLAILGIYAIIYGWNAAEKGSQW